MAFRIRKGQHNNRSPPYVGFFTLFCNVIIKFCNSATCVSTSQWDSKINVQEHLNTTTVVVLQVVSFGRIHGFKLYSNIWICLLKWAHQCQKNILRSPSPV